MGAKNPEQQARRRAMMLNDPVSRVIPEKVKDKLDIYMARKRG